jgi:hypothetical protein
MCLDLSETQVMMEVLLKVRSFESFAISVLQNGSRGWTRFINLGFLA